VSERLTVIGTSRDRHDLSGSTPRFARTAASPSNACRSSRIDLAGELPQRRWRNFDAFDLGLNYLQ
jgi:phosphonoacetate hydrolase